MENSLKVKIEKVNGVLVTTSNRVAEELGVNHRDLLEKIDGYIKRFARAEDSAFGINSTSTEFYIPSTYKVEGNFKEYKNYLITEKGIAQLISGYNSSVPKAFALNIAYINEFERMRHAMSEVKKTMTLREALLIALEQEERAEQLAIENKVKDQQIAEMTPKVSYYDNVLKSTSLLKTTDIAKDYGMSAQTMNKILHNLGVQYKQSGTWFLYKEYQDKGYTQTKITTYEKPDGAIGTNIHMYWKQSGRLFLYDLLKKNNILPLIEQGEEDRE